MANKTVCVMLPVKQPIRIDKGSFSPHNRKERASVAFSACQLLENIGFHKYDSRNITGQRDNMTLLIQSFISAHRVKPKAIAD